MKGGLGLRPPGGMDYQDAELAAIAFLVVVAIGLVIGLVTLVCHFFL